MSPDPGPYLRRYVSELRQSNAIRLAAVEQAFLTVPRHLFLSKFYHCTSSTQSAEDAFVLHGPSNTIEDEWEVIYSDRALVTQLRNRRPSSSASKPSLVARMLEYLELRAGMRVLEIGTGTGYNAALLAVLVGDQQSVVTLDVSAELVARARSALTASGYPGVRVYVRDGFYGDPERGPYDRIVATVGCPDLSPHWVGQLAKTGIMLIPLEHAGHHPLIRIWTESGHVRGRIVEWTGFVRIAGRLEGSGPACRRLALRDDWTRLAQEGLIREHALWEGYGAGPRLPGVPWGSRAVDLFFFLSLRDARATWTPWGFGLVDSEGGWALVSDDRIYSCGDQQPVRDLKQLYEEWEVSGAPGIFDYEMEFVPQKRVRAGTPPGAHVVTRRFFQQQVSVP
ncbi:MAG: protein-L-isoaspartate O-methyltransferase family protein [Egibacteraceae bacterium]